MHAPSTQRPRHPRPPPRAVVRTASNARRVSKGHAHKPAAYLHRPKPVVVAGPPPSWVERQGRWLVLAFLVLSVVFHLGLREGAERLGQRVPPPKKPQRLEVAVIQAPEKPPPPAPEPPKPPPPKKVVKFDKPPPKPPKIENLPPPPPDVPPPPPDAAPPPPNAEAPKETAPPVLIAGLTLDSTSANGSFAVNTGNTLYAQPAAVAVKPEDVKPYKAEKYAPSYALTVMPSCEPVDGDRFQRDYPKEARDADVEGEVRAKITLDDDGSVVEVKIVSHPGYGLDSVTKRLLMTKGVVKCRPGTVNGQVVATEIPFSLFWELGD